MCRITENGYELECSGRLIPFTGINLALLTAEEFAELRATDVDMISHMQIKSAVLRIEDKLDVVATCVDKVVKTDLNEVAVIGVVEAWYEGVLKNLANPDHDYSKRFTARIIRDVKQFLKDTFLTVGSLAKVFIALGVIAGFFGAIIVSIMKLIGMK